MKKIENYNLPAHVNSIYEKEASSAIFLVKEIADKINEIVSAYNTLSKEDLEWKQTQEGRINKGIIFLKDNLINSINELLPKYESEAIRSFAIEIFANELNRITALEHLKIIATPQMFGAKGNGIANDVDAIEAAINSLYPGGILFFPNGTYLMNNRAVEINRSNITFMGSGTIECNHGFRVNASHFKAIGLKMHCNNATQNSRAFMIDQSGENPKYLEDFTFKDCEFTGFFYSIAAIGGSYSYDGTEEARGYPVRDLVIENCISTAPANTNAGHFQCIQVENISYINNRTYGGQNASSYNAIKGNGFIRVIGNYDHNNSYASCEIENGSGRAVIANNTFRSKIWIDDSFDAVVNGNTTEEGILVSVGSNNGNAKNIVIANNVCRNIRCEQFGEYLGGIIEHVMINGNTVKGTNTHGIWIHGNAVKNAKICNNMITGENTNDIAIQRNDQLSCMISGNFGNGKLLLIAGSGGKVYAFDNLNLTSSGNRDSLPASHLERSFNGVKVEDSSGTPWRINVSSSGAISAIKY